MLSIHLFRSRPRHLFPVVFVSSALSGILALLILSTCPVISICLVEFCLSLSPLAVYAFFALIFSSFSSAYISFRFVEANLFLPIRLFTATENNYRCCNTIDTHLSAIRPRKLSNFGQFSSAPYAHCRCGYIVSTTHLQATFINQSCSVHVFHTNACQ